MSGQAAILPVPARRPFQGVVQIVRYNWPLYLAGGLIGAAAFGVLRLAPLPGALRSVVFFGTALAIYWLLMSLAVSFYVYDYSPLYRWQWIADMLPQPNRWANIHCGLDESTPALRELFGKETALLDIYDPGSMTEPSIGRARRLTPPVIRATAADYRRLPCEDCALDAIFLVFAAHELRDPRARLQFFAELKRVLQPGGRIVIIEHPRNVSNFVAFGPGFLHFLPRSVWTGLAAANGLRIEREKTMTPFVRIFVLERPR